MASSSSCPHDLTAEPPAHCRLFPTTIFSRSWSAWIVPHGVGELGERRMGRTVIIFTRRCQRRWAPGYDRFQVECVAKLDHIRRPDYDFWPSPYPALSLRESRHRRVG